MAFIYRAYSAARRLPVERSTAEIVKAKERASPSSSARTKPFRQQADALREADLRQKEMELAELQARGRAPHTTTSPTHPAIVWTARRTALSIRKPMHGTVHGAREGSHHGLGLARRHPRRGPTRLRGVVAAKHRARREHMSECDAPPARKAYTTPGTPPATSATSCTSATAWRGGRLARHHARCEDLPPGDPGARGVPRRRLARAAHAASFARHLVCTRCARCHGVAGRAAEAGSPKVEVARAQSTRLNKLGYTRCPRGHPIAGAQQMKMEARAARHGAHRPLNVIDRRQGRGSAHRDAPSTGRARTASSAAGTRAIDQVLTNIIETALANAPGGNRSR